MSGIPSRDVALPERHSPHLVRVAVISATAPRPVLFGRVLPPLTEVTRLRTGPTTVWAGTDVPRECRERA